MKNEPKPHREPRYERFHGNRYIAIEPRYDGHHDKSRLDIRL